jgi:sulfhydrogenase subunit beta (sulfur reductase)
MIKSINKEQFKDLAKSISADYDLYLPKKNQGGVFVFSKVSNLNTNFNFEFPTTMIPPTSFLLPFEDRLFKIKGNDYKEIKDNSRPIALIGVKDFDLEAINRLLKIFSQDKKLLANRNRLLLIGIDSDYLDEFDQALLNDNIEGYDLKLSSSPNNQWYISSDSEKGDRILATSNLEDARPKFGRKRTGNKLLNLEKIKWAVEKTRGGKVWQKWAKICLGCSNCTYLCPICFCYSIDDKVDIDGGVTRTRTRSSCFNYSFDKMSGNNNPKPDFVDRFYHFYYHKFVAMPEQYGFSGCVNCGRCLKYCPVDINFRTVLSEAIKEAENG